MNHPRIEYRRVDSGGGGWPGTYLDIAAAIDHLRTIAREHPLDREKVITVGHSAGGQLALWAVARQRLTEENPLHMKNPLPLRGAVNLAGPGRLQSLSNQQQTLRPGPSINGFRSSRQPQSVLQCRPSSYWPA